MKIKKILAGVISAAMLLGNAAVLAADIPEKTWTFDGITEKPAEFTDNNPKKALPLSLSHKGSDGSGNAFGFVCGVGVGMGNGVINTASNGYRIAVPEITEVTDGVVNYAYDFLVGNQNVCAWLVAPRFGDSLELDGLVSLSNGNIQFGDQVLGTIQANEWHTVGAQYRITPEGAVMDVILDGVRAVENYALKDAAKDGIKQFSLLVNPHTTTEQFQQNTRFDGRDEIFYMDNLYIGQNPNYFQGVYKVNSVAQGAKMNEINVSFNREPGAASSSDFSVSNRSVSGVRTDGKTVVLTLSEDLTPGEDYTVTVSDQLLAADGTAFSGTNSFTVSATYPKTVNMEWTFDDKAIPPKYFAYNNKQVPAAAKDGVSGKPNDYSFQYLIGIGGGRADGVLNKYTNGFRVFSKGELGFLVNDVTLCYDLDFMVKAKTLVAQLFSPNMGGTNYNPFRSVIVNNGIISCNGEAFAEIEPNEWHNLGVVYTLSSANGMKADIYLDGIKRYTDSDNSVTAKSGLGCFNLLASANTDPNDPRTRFDDRNEYFVMDNLYIGDDFSRVISGLMPASSNPANGAEGVEVDQPVSVTFNDTVANDDVSGALSLTSPLGSQPISEITKSQDGYTLTASYDGILNYRDTYTISFSGGLLSGFGKTISKDAKITFKTKDYYPYAMTVSNLTKENGTATATVTLSQNTAEQTVIMAAYDKNGVMKKAVSAQVMNQANLSVACEGQIKIICIDSLSGGILTAAPYIEGDAEDGYYLNNPALALSKPETKNCVITISGTSNLKKGYVLGKIAANGKKTDSQELSDYLTIDAARTGLDGSFSFAGRTDAANGEYAYSAKTEQALQEGTVAYQIQDGRDIRSFSLNGSSANISGTNITFTTSESDLSGFLAGFTLSEKASLYAGDQLLESGVSRLNCTSPVTLTVRSEFGSEKTYTLTVTKKTTTGGGSGGGSGSGSSGNSGLAITVPSGTVTEDQKIPEPLDEITTRFGDVQKTYWAYDAIKALAEKGIISGVSEDSFAPEREITREEFCVLLQRVFKLAHADKRISFDDIPEDAWYQDAVYILAENGIVNGMDLHTFGVGRTITRQDMAVLIAGCIKNAEETREYADFADEDQISEYAKDAVKMLYCAKILNGMGDDTFAPQNSATRAQTAVILSLL